MQSGYPYENIWVNGRLISLSKILQDQAEPTSSFEKTLFSFLNDFVAGDKQFTINTSGSTGNPKQITLNKSQLEASATQTTKALGLQQNSNALLCMDPKYIGGRMMVVRALINNMRLYAIEPSANPLVRIPIDTTIQFAAFVPYQVQTILDSTHNHLLNNIDNILIGGGALNADTIKLLQHYQCKIFSTYGMTETISHIALQQINAAYKEDYYTALPNIELRSDSRGCLVIQAPYLEEEVITNDLVELRDQKRFKWLGRYDNVINTGGIKVIPEIIETALSALFQSKNISNRFYISSLPDAKLGNKVILVIEGGLTSTVPLLKSLEEFKRIPSQRFHTPKEVYHTSSFTMTDTGKINRNQSLKHAELLLSL